MYYHRAVNEVSQRCSVRQNAKHPWLVAQVMYALPSVCTQAGVGQHRPAFWCKDTARGLLVLCGYTRRYEPIRLSTLCCLTIRGGQEPSTTRGSGKNGWTHNRAGDAIRTRDNLLGRQELCQLSYARTVGVRGLEPPTSASQTLRATRLRYTPAISV